MGKPHYYQKVIICPIGVVPPYLCLWRCNFCAARAFAFGLSNANFALPGTFSLVTAVRFWDGQEALSIDYSGAKYVCLALSVLRDVITSVFS